MNKEVSEAEVQELYIFIHNEESLYRQYTIPMIANLKRKNARGTYNRELAVKLWMYLADAGAKLYDKFYGSGRGSLTLFNKATRLETAKLLRDRYEEEILEEEGE